MPDKDFTCNACGTVGSLRWMSEHNCRAVQDVKDFGGRCEDYPCCGHLPGECEPQERFTKDYWLERMAEDEYDPYGDEWYEESDYDAFGVEL